MYAAESQSFIRCWYRYIRSVHDIYVKCYGRKQIKIMKSTYVFYNVRKNTLTIVYIQYYI